MKPELVKMGTHKFGVSLASVLGGDVSEIILKQQEGDSRNDVLQEASELISGLDREELVQFLELARAVTGKA